MHVAVAAIAAPLSLAFHVSSSCPTLCICPQLLPYAVQKYCLLFFSLSAPWPHPSFTQKDHQCLGIIHLHLKKRWMISRYASWAVHAVAKVHMGSTKMCPGNRAVRETIGSRQYMYSLYFCTACSIKHVHI